MHFYGVKVKLHVDVHMQRYSCSILHFHCQQKKSVQDK